MDLLVALSTQSDQVFVRVIAEQAARRNVMNLKSNPTIFGSHSQHVCLLDVLAHFRTAGAAAARRTIAQELLSSPSAIDLADVNISVGVDSYHVRPVELARLAASPSEAT